MDYRMEADSIGEKKVPAGAYYGVQSLRAKENFYITGRRIPEVQIRSIAEIKKACAMVNGESGALDKNISVAITEACDEIISGKFHDQFIVDMIQGGAGTSVNMNANEVIANLALEKLGKGKGEYGYCHPNDHVNMSQSTNDVYPTSLKMSVYRTGLILINKLDELDKALLEKSRQFRDVLKTGRTQLMDAVPITLGREFHAYGSAVKRNRKRIRDALDEMLLVNMGGTAVGTGVNTTDHYVKNIIPAISEVSGLDLKPCYDMVDGTQNVESFSAVSSSLKACAVSLSKMANDIRLMNSGPRTGFGEISIPAKQNGSSIMPGKINPVIPEVLNQCAFGVIGNDAAVTMACEAGQLELNAFEPVIFDRICDSLSMLINGVDTFICNCIVGIRANKKRCRDLLDLSTGYITLLSPMIGYKKSAKIAKDFLDSKKSVLEIALANGVTEKQFNKALDLGISESNAR